MKFNIHKVFCHKKNIFSSISVETWQAICKILVFLFSLFI